MSILFEDGKIKFSQYETMNGVTVLDLKEVNRLLPKQIL